MTWGAELPKVQAAGRPPLPSNEKCGNRIILYVTADEKTLYQQRAEDKNDSVSNYIRTHLRPITEKLRLLYGEQTQPEKKD